MRRSALVVLLLVAGCGRQPAAENAANETAARPVAEAKPLPPWQQIAAAFAVAYPKGAVVNTDMSELTFVAKRLVPVGSDRVALLAEGGQEDGCHACTGQLRVTYLRRDGAGFAALTPTVEAAIAGNGFGAPPDWTLVTTGPVPLLTITAGYTAQGCTETQTEVYRLEPAGVVEDKAAKKTAKEGC